MYKLIRHAISFKHAFAGIRYAITTQPNFQIHLSIAFFVLILGFYFHITQLEWVIIIFTIFWVLLAEMVNTSIESIIDLLTDKYHLSAKLAKDVSAGMVLLSAVASVIIGLVIFIPHFLSTPN